MPESSSLKTLMKITKENYKAILLLVLLTATIHMAFNIWYISISPEIINDQMNRIHDNDTRDNLPISKIASYTIGEYADFQRAPLFNFYEFVIYSIFGYKKPNLILSVVFFKAVFGTVLLYLVTRRLFGEKLALAVSIMHAIYFDYLIFPSLRTSYSNFNFVYFLAMLYLFLDFFDNGYSKKNLLLHFIIYGLALNTDSKFLLFPVFEIMTFFVLNKRINKFVFLRTFACYMGFLAILLPFLIRNYMYLGEFRPTQNNLIVALSTGIARQQNPYFVNKKFPYIYTKEEAKRIGIQPTREYEEKVLVPELKRRLKEVILHDKQLLLNHFIYNFIRLTLPWTMNDPHIKERLLKKIPVEPVEKISTRKFQPLSWKKITSYFEREVFVITDITTDFMGVVFKIEIYLIPYLLRYFYIAGVLIMLKQKKFRELLIVSLPVIYSTSTLFWIITNPDYLMASYITFFIMSAITIKSFSSLFWKYYSHILTKAYSTQKLEKTI